MKKIYFFILANSPQCKRTQQRLINIISQNQEYRKLPIEIVDILENYFFVKQFKIEKYPAFYIGKNKLYEGEMDIKEIIQMLNKLVD